MTSKTSSFRFGKLVMHRFKQLAWLTTLWSAGLFFALPVAQSIRLRNYSPPVSEGDHLPSAAKTVNELLSPENYLLLAAALAVGLVAACAVQAFINSRTQNDLWLSLPVRREKLFAVNLAAGSMAVLIPLAVFWAVTAAVTLLMPQAGYYFDPATAFAGFLYVAGVFLVSYAIANLWCVICGHTVIAVLCALFTPLIGTGAAVMFGYFYSWRFSTFHWSDALNRAMEWLCPYVPFFTHNQGEEMRIAAAVWTAVAIGLLALSFRLFQTRVAEAAGKALAYPKALPVVKYPLIVFSAAIGWLLFNEITDSTGWAAFGAATVGFCVFCFVNVLEKFDFRNILHHWWKYAAVMAAFGLFVGGLMLDPFSYDTRLPARQDITSAKVYSLTMNGSDSNFGFAKGKTEDPELIDALYELSEFAVAHADRLRSNGSYSYYPDVRETVWLDLNFTVAYGGFARRYRFQINADEAADLTLLSENGKFAAKTSGAYAFEPEEVAVVRVDFFQSEFRFNAEGGGLYGSEGGGDTAQLIAALRSDALQISAVRLKDARMLCVLSLTDGTGTWVEFPVYDFFGETRRTWLWAIIEANTLHADAGDIDRIEVESYKYGNREVVADAQRIGELSKALVFYREAVYNPFILLAGDISVTVYYKNGGAEPANLRRSMTPDWLETGGQ